MEVRSVLLSTGNSKSMLQGTLASHVPLLFPPSFGYCPVIVPELKNSAKKLITCMFSLLISYMYLFIYSASCVLCLLKNVSDQRDLNSVNCYLRTHSAEVGLCYPRGPFQSPRFCDLCTPANAAHSQPFTGLFRGRVSAQLISQTLR